MFLKEVTREIQYHIIRGLLREGGAEENVPSSNIDFLEENGMMLKTIGTWYYRGQREGWTGSEL